MPRLMGQLHASERLSPPGLGDRETGEHTPTDLRCPPQPQLATRPAACYAEPAWVARWRSHGTGVAGEAVGMTQYILVYWLRDPDGATPVALIVPGGRIRLNGTRDPELLWAIRDAL